MNIDKNLTVILTLKDRVEFTYRWMTYASQTRFPFKILIADGGKDKTIEKDLSEKRNYPNLNYEYIRYPYDETYSIYHEKKVDALSKVDTPFVVFADNDDFIIVEGLLRSVDFLMNNQEYATCKGQIVSFSITPDINALYGEELRYSYEPCHAIEYGTATERINAHFCAYSSTYYDVHRTAEMKNYFQVLRDIDPKDVTIAELLTSFMTVASGKIKKGPYPYLLRQHHLNTNCLREDAMFDRFDRVLFETWSRDFNIFVDTVARIVADKDGITIENAVTHVKMGYRKYIAPIIIDSLQKDLPPPPPPPPAPFIKRLLLTSYLRMRSLMSQKNSERESSIYNELNQNEEVSRIRKFLIDGLTTPDFQKHKMKRVY